MTHPVTGGPFARRLPQRSLAPHAPRLRPPGATSLLLAGGPLDPTGALPADTAVWLRA
ncbi:hypothetical protein [Streptomyces sp. NPDC093105]|uniref:hypothetical protein n=1 Tax=Streptomyces sp. NPDC093105 TaxID=3366029 RepID=UPI0038303CBF